MKCVSCGVELSDKTKVCQFCGATVISNQPLKQTPNGSKKMKRREFYNLPKNGEIKKKITQITTCLYIISACSIIMNRTAGIFIALLIAALFIGLGIGIGRFQSKVCAIILTVYSLLNTLVGIVLTGEPTSFVVLLASAMALKNVMEFDKAYNKYLQT